MKTHTLPAKFNGKAFAARYGLSNILGEFWSDGVLLYYPDSLPDKPIFDPPDPPGPTKEQILEQRLAAIETRLSDVEAKQVPIGVV